MKNFIFFILGCYSLTLSSLGLGADGGGRAQAAGGGAPASDREEPIDLNKLSAQLVAMMPAGPAGEAAAPAGEAAAPVVVRRGLSDSERRISAVMSELHSDEMDSCFYLQATAILAGLFPKAPLTVKSLMEGVPGSFPAIRASVSSAGFSPVVEPFKVGPTFQLAEEGLNGVLRSLKSRLRYHTVSGASMSEEKFRADVARGKKLKAYVVIRVTRGALSGLTPDVLSMMQLMNYGVLADILRGLSNLHYLTVLGENEDGSFNVLDTGDREVAPGRRRNVVRMTYDQIRAEMSAQKTVSGVKELKRLMEQDDDMGNVIRAVAQMIQLKLAPAKYIDAMVAEGYMASRILTEKEVAESDANARALAVLAKALLEAKQAQELERAARVDGIVREANRNIEDPD